MARKPVQQSAWSAVETEVVAPRPPIEVHATRVEPSDTRVSTGARRVIKPALDNGWEVRVTYARGPYLGAKGESLRIVDSILVKGRRVLLDGTVDRFAATWIDGGFETAYAGTIGNPPERISASDLTKRIKA